MLIRHKVLIITELDKKRTKNKKIQEIRYILNSPEEDRVCTRIHKHSMQICERRVKSQVALEHLTQQVSYDKAADATLFEMFRYTYFYI